MIDAKKNEMESRGPNLVNSTSPRKVSVEFSEVRTSLSGMNEFRSLMRPISVLILLLQMFVESLIHSYWVYNI